MADIADITGAERVIEILHPGTGEPVGIRVTIMSADDDRMKGINRRIQDERLRLEQRNKSFKSEDLENNLHNICAKAMTGWKWYDPKDEENGKDPATFHGQIPEFTPRNVLAVLTEKGWFENQIVTEISDEKAFYNNAHPT